MRENFVVHSKFTVLISELKQTLHDFDSKGEYVIKGNRNHIKKVTIADELYNIKQFKTPTFFQGLVYQFIRKSKARRSFEYACKLIDFGIKTPFPIAYYERLSGGLKESYYISKHLDYDLDFRVLNHNPKFTGREEILKQFATFTFKLHENGINFLDHSPGNTLIVEKEQGNYDFYLIDLNRMRFETMGFQKRMKNFRRLWLSKTMINIMAPVYAKLYRKSEAETHQLMSKYSRKFQKKINSKKLRKK